jgi:hypothetical protein
VYTSFLSHACYMSQLSHPPWSILYNNIWWSVHVMKLLILQTSPASRRNPFTALFLSVHTHKKMELNIWESVFISEGINSYHYIFPIPDSVI